MDILISGRSAGFVILAAAILVSGCVDPQMRKPREAWRDRAEASCVKAGFVRPSATVKQLPPIKGPGSCGAKRPFSVAVAPKSGIALQPAATLACPMASSVDGWLARDVQPAAYAMFGEPVVQIDVAGSYSCRTRNHKRGAKMSEHAYANGLDVSGFRLLSGRRISVKGGWHGASDEAAFLREAHRSACTRFKTIIGPDGDRHHRDHFHFDLAWHNKDGTYIHCE